MIINGTKYQLNGHCLKAIGLMLLYVSPSKDGRGLGVQLTEGEAKEIEATFGINAGCVLHQAIAEAIGKTTGKSPEISYSYYDRIFDSISDTPWV